MPPARLAVLISLLPFANLALPAQKPTNPPPANSTAWTEEVVQDFNGPIPTIRTTARLVVLDVVVTDADGNPVHGLKPSDFTLLEDGMPQKLASFTEYDASTLAPPPPASPLPPNTFTVHAPSSEGETKTVIVIADSTAYNPNPEFPPFPSSGAANSSYVRDQVAAFLKSAAPGLAIAIIRLDWQGMHLVQGLTADHQVLFEAIQSKRMLPPLGFPVRFQRAPGRPAEHLVRYVASIPGRINLVWLGRGSQQMINQFPDLTDVAQQLGNSTRVLRLSRVALYPISISGYLPTGSTDEDLDARTEAIADGLFANSDLTDLATAAGGHAYFNGIRQALHEIADTGSDYYAVSYVPANTGWDGGFHRIRVNVAGYPQPRTSEMVSTVWSDLLGWTEEDRSKVLYRRGYFARPNPSPVQDAVRAAQGSGTLPDPNRKLLSYSPKGDPNGPGAATETALDRAMKLGSLPFDEINFTVAASPSAEVDKLKPGAPLPKDNLLTQPFRQDAYRNVHIHYRIDPHSLKYSQNPPGAYSDNLEFVAVVYRDDGTPVDSIASTEKIQVFADGIEDALNSGITFDQTIAVPIAGNPVPGSFFLRTGVLETSTGHIGTIEISSESIKLPPTQTLAAQ